MVEHEVKDIQNIPVGPIRKLIAENAKSNSMVIKVICIPSDLSYFPFFFGTDTLLDASLKLIIST